MWTITGYRVCRRVLVRRNLGMGETLGLKWYVAITKPAQEYRASYELLNQNFQTFIPTMKLKPLFARYIFVKFDRDKDPWGSIRSTRGCVDLLRSGYLPQSVPDPVMDALMVYKDDPDALPAEPVYTKGQRVTVCAGPFSSFEGLFQKSAQGRVKVLLSLFGTQREVEMPITDIRAA
jgi:transcriptional antiterminator RfaH